MNNAGISASGAVEEIPLSDFRRVMETNYFGVLRCTKAVLPGMRERRSAISSMYRGSAVDWPVCGKGLYGVQMGIGSD